MFAYYTCTQITLTNENMYTYNTSLGLTKDTKYFESFYIDLSLNPKLPRETITAISHLRAGLYSSNASLARINAIPDAKCQCGDPVQDANHIFWQCPLQDEVRSTFLKQLVKLKFNLPLNGQTLVFDPTSVT